MRRLNLLAALLLMVVGVQTADAQGFRVYKSDGTVAQFSLRTDSIVFYDGIGTDQDFGPFTPVNQMIVGTWYKSRTESVTFNEDGTTDYIEGATYEFMPYQGSLVIFNALGTPVQVLRVPRLTADMLLLATGASPTSFVIYSRMCPVQLVTDITLSKKSVILQPNDMEILTATVLPENADNKTVTWESSNEEIAEVNKNGRVIANGYGACTITCSATDDSGVKAECQVVVVPAGQTYTVNGVSFKMMPVEGGTFMMGSNNGEDDEMPVHEVTLSSFSIGETEVTQALWFAVMGANPTSSNSWSTTCGLGDNYPAYYISWDICQSFITKLNQLTGASFRLPTEAEWEYAARGGNKSQGYIFSGSNTIGDVAWYRSNSDNTTHEVATKAPNELGIYDMSGSVWEWCQDWYGSYSSGNQTNPTGPASGSYRVVRGGSWSHYAAGCRVSNRPYSNPTHTLDNLGLRLAL